MCWSVHVCTCSGICMCNRMHQMEKTVNSFQKFLIFPVRLFQKMLNVLSEHSFRQHIPIVEHTDPQLPIHSSFKEQAQFFPYENHCECYKKLASRSWLMLFTLTTFFLIHTLSSSAGK